MCMNVDLPEPDGPDHGHEFAISDVEGDAPQGPHHVIADVVFLLQIANPDHAWLVLVTSYPARAPSPEPRAPIGVSS